MNIKDLFNKLSYLQYPLMVGAVCWTGYLMYQTLNGQLPQISDLTTVLTLAGLGINFSSMQDTSKVQNKSSLKIWQDPKKAIPFLWMVGITSMLFLLAGLGFYFIGILELKELGLSFMLFSLGFFSMLKVGSELFENHRLD